MMLMRPSTALKELSQLLKEEREKIQSGYYPKKLIKNVLKRFDEFCTWLQTYLTRKVFFCKYHFNAIWSANWFCYVDPSVKAKVHNTAANHIYLVLLRFKEKHEREAK